LSAFWQLHPRLFAKSIAAKTFIMADNSEASISAQAKPATETSHFEEMKMSDSTEVDQARLEAMERTCVRKLDLLIAPLIGAFNFMVRTFHSARLKRSSRADG
jgi:hypothetical protein